MENVNYGAAGQGAGSFAGGQAAAGADGAESFADRQAAAGADGAGQRNPSPAFAFLPAGLESLAQGYSEPRHFWADVSRLKAADAEAKALGSISAGNLATNDDYERAFAALGRPDDKTGYRLPEAWEGEIWTPDGKGAGKAGDAVAARVNEYLAESGERDQFADIARRCDLTQKQAEKLFSLYGGVLARHMEREMVAAEEAAPEKTLARLWPRNTRAELDVAVRGARAAGIGAELDAAGLSAHPLVLRLAHALGRAVGEDGAPSGSAAPLPSGEGAKSELRRVVAGAAYKNNDPQAIRLAERLAERSVS